MTATKKNILMINDEGCRVGGAAIYTDSLAQELRKRGHHVDILASDVAYARNRFDTASYQGHDETSISRVWLQLYKPDARKVLEKTVAKNKYDIIHIHSILTQSSTSIFLGLGNATVVMTLHDNLLTSPYDNLDAAANKHTGLKKHALLLAKKHIWYLYTVLRNTLYRQVLGKVHLFICPSTYIQKEMRKEYPKVKTVLIPNSARLFSPTKIPKKNTILFVGRLAKEKGASVLIEALAIVRKSVDSDLLIVGEGPELGELRAHTKQLGLEKNVQFAGYVPPEKLAAYYARATVVAIPSIGEESFSLVGIEAFSAGKPVIASNVGGIPDWLSDGKTGYLAPAGNSAAFADRIVKLLTNPSRLQKMAAAAVITSRQYSFDHHVKRIEHAYAEAQRIHLQRSKKNQSNNSN